MTEYQSCQKRRHFQSTLESKRNLGTNSALSQSYRAEHLHRVLAMQRAYVVEIAGLMSEFTRTSLSMKVFQAWERRFMEEIDAGFNPGDHGLRSRILGRSGEEAVRICQILLEQGETDEALLVLEGELATNPASQELRDVLKSFAITLPVTELDANADEA